MSWTTPTPSRYRPYRCGDGRYMTVGALEPRFWRALVTSMGFPELEADQFGPPERQSEMSKQLEEAFGRRPRDDWLRDLEGIEACVGPVNDMADAVADPQVRHRGMIAQMDGRAVGPGSPFRFDGEHATAARPAPELGEHTAEVLAGIEVGESELAKLRTRGVV